MTPVVVTRPRMGAPIPNGQPPIPRFRWADVVKVALIAVAVLYFNTMLVWWAATAYAEAHADKPRPAIFQVVEEELPPDVVQLYPNDPNVNVLWADGQGRGLHWRMTPQGIEALRRWVGGE